ncbi:MAG: hypothetical protein JO244_08905 [Solirubrobacterales bacterium]|nr:hypothetical protein [Solirubrobacterales bacterium]
MNRLSHSFFASDPVVAATEAATGALRAVEAVAASLPEHDDGLQARREHLQRAVEHLQAASSELRFSSHNDPFPGPRAFVLAARRRRLRQPPEDGPQASE